MHLFVSISLRDLSGPILLFASYIPPRNIHTKCKFILICYLRLCGHENSKQQRPTLKFS